MQFVLALLAVVATAGGLRAQALDIDNPEIKRGETEIKSVNTFHHRYPPGATGVPASSHEASIGHSFTDHFKITAHVALENIKSESLRGDHVAVETQLELIKAGERGGLGLGWLTVVQPRIHRDATSAVVFGPIAKLSNERLALVVNPYFEKTYGENRVDGVAFVYGWQGKLVLREGVAVGIEGFGKIENVGNAAPWSEQDHRIGPALMLEWELAKDRNLMLDMGVLAGLTLATPDVTYKFSVATTF